MFVTDLNQAGTFYADMLELPVSLGTDGTVGFDMGVQVMIEVDDGEHENLPGRFTGLSIAAGDVQAEYERLKERGVPFIGPPERQPWGGTLARFTDPSMNIGTLVGG